MAQYIDKDALVAEIESRIKSIEECFNGKFPISQSVKETEQDKGKLVAYKSIISLIDTTEVKEVDLDIAIGEYCSNPDNIITYIDVAFPYRSEQKDDIPLISKAIKFGANWQKEQMMAKAIYGTARPDDNEIWCNLASFNLKHGDKVKIIILKED